jgi:hypothetical protein
VGVMENTEWISLTFQVQVLDFLFTFVLSSRTFLRRGVWILLPLVAHAESVTGFALQSRLDVSLCLNRLLIGTQHHRAADMQV